MLYEFVPCKRKAFITYTDQCRVFLEDVIRWCDIEASEKIFQKTASELIQTTKS